VRVRQGKQFYRHAAWEARQVGDRVSSARGSGRPSSGRVRAWARSDHVADGDAVDADHDGDRRAADRAPAACASAIASATACASAGNRSRA